MTQTTDRRPDTINSQEIEEFKQNGYIRLGKMVHTQQLTDLQERINQIMLGEVHYPDMLMQLDSETGDYSDLGPQEPGFQGASLNYRKIEQLEKDPRFLDYLQSPIVNSICNEFIGPEVSIYRSMFMNKPAGYGTLLPWHQDGGDGWGLSMDPEITIWLALDPATQANGCVQVIPGSHKLGLLSKVGHVISEQHIAEHCPEDSIEYLELEAGEAVILHNFLLHRSNKNNSQQSRRAFSVCLMDGATTHKRDTDTVYPQLFGTDAL